MKTEEITVTDTTLDTTPELVGIIGTDECYDGQRGSWGLNPLRSGLVAQLGERRTGSAEVACSIHVESIGARNTNGREDQSRPFER